MRNVLRVLAEIPLQMTDQSRAIIDDAEEHGRRPLSAHRQHRTRAEVTVPVNEPAHVLGLIAAHLARGEPCLGALGTERVAGRQASALAPALALEQTPDARVGGNGRECGVRFSARAQVIVMELDRPTRVGGVLRAQLLTDRQRHLLRAGIRAHLAAKYRDRIASLAPRPQQPALDRRERKAHRLAGDRMLPGTCAQPLELSTQRAPRRRSRQKLPNDREAQMCPTLVYGRVFWPAHLRIPPHLSGYAYRNRGRRLRVMHPLREQYGPLRSVLVVAADPQRREPAQQRQ